MERIAGATLREARYGASRASRGTDALASQPVRRAHSARSGRRMSASSCGPETIHGPRAARASLRLLESRSPPVPGPPSIRKLRGPRVAAWRVAAAPRCGGSGPSPGRMRLLRRLVTAAESAGEPRPAMLSTRAEWCHVGCTFDRDVARGLPLGGARIRQAESQWKPLGAPSHVRCANPHTQRGRATLLRARAAPKRAGYVLARSVHSVRPHWKLPAAAVGN